jgi:NET1-associated nuclear protein 1 (U3 small nucleolar RNA-associated protein 17)
VIKKVQSQIVVADYQAGTLQAYIQLARTMVKTPISKRKLEQDSEKSNSTHKRPKHIGDAPVQPSPSSISKEGANVAEASTGTPNKGARTDGLSRRERKLLKAAEVSGGKPSSRTSKAEPGSEQQSTTPQKSVASHANDSPAQSSGVKKTKRRSKRSHETELLVGDASAKYPWSFSGPTAGRLIPHDAVFVRDERGRSCLLAASDSEVQLLSLDDSLVIRSHATPEGRYISCFSVDGDVVDIAYDDHSTIRWNYLNSSNESGRTFAKPITAMANAKNAETCYLHVLSGHSSIVRGGKVLFKTNRILTEIEVHDSAIYVFAWGPSTLVIGTRKGTTTTNTESGNFTWLELPMEVSITCATSRLVPPEGGVRDQQTRKPELAVAIGNREGQIHLYYNLSAMFGSTVKADPPVPQILHWHRLPVAAVKFSKDGNYLVTGGQETVLVLWQLATSKKQFLPHLTSGIERIVISPNGANYALQMADNSIMVLNTSELKAVAHFPGLQLAVQRGGKSTSNLRSLPKAAAVMHPLKHRQVLLTVPSVTSQKSADASSRPFLQTFDLHNGRHISRQALTRNNVTDFNESPEGNPIVSPDVTFIAISHNGKWLATVDEWAPPTTDLKHVTIESDMQGKDAAQAKRTNDEQALRREVHLKIWQWNETQGIWMLNTRADKPHARAAGAHLGAGAGRILKLAADPSVPGFVTVGEDNSVKTWRPKLQLQHGLPLQDEQGNDQVEWSCRRTIQLPSLINSRIRSDTPTDTSLAISQEIKLKNACLAFSPDGSLIACAPIYYESDESSLVHFISPDSGSIVETKSRLTLPGSELVDLAFIDRYFISLSKSTLRVWNLVDDAYRWTISFSASAQNLDDPILAVDHASNNFCVVTTELLPGRGAEETRVARVFTPKVADRLYEAQLSLAPVAVLASQNARGFTFLFANGTIRTLEPNSSTSSRELAVTGAAQADLELPDAEVQSVVDMTSALATEGDVDMVDATADGVDVVMDIDGGEDDRPVVRPEQLASIFDISSGLALPPVRDMFQAVVGLYSKKPRTVDAVM